MSNSHDPFIPPRSRSAARVASCALAVALVASCDKGEGDGGGSGGDDDLEGRTYYAQSATDDGEDHPFVDGTTVRLSFGEGGQVGASAGCNSLGGSYAIEDDKLVISNAGWTEIGCDPDVGAQETWYFEFLQSEPTLVQDGDELTLTGDVTEIVYLDKEVADPDRELVGPVWTVDTLIDGETASSADWSDLATFQFDQQGQVQVTTGCNTGSGGYVVDGGEITFDGVAVTEEACADELQQALEDAVLLVVHHAGPVAFEIDANRLWLEIDGAGLGLATE